MWHRANKIGLYTLFVLFIIGISFIGNQVQRHQSITLFLCYFTAFFCYFWIIRGGKPNFRTTVFLGLCARLTLFFSLPSLSDDFYRFIWDGHLVSSGIDPYATTPEQLPKTDLLQSLFPKLNSPAYLSVYPPLNQAIFWLASFGSDLLSGVNLIRGVILIADLGVLLVLHKMIEKDSQLKVAWYFLNPLVILEGVGNLHFEVIVIVFLLSGLYFLGQRRWLASGLMVGLSIGTKLVPLVFLPYLGWKFRWKSGIIVVTTALAAALITFLPFISSSLASGMSESLKLYFQSFEFNASWYFVFREIGWWQVGYNTIQTLGPKLATWSFVLITSLAIWGSYRNVNRYAILLFSVFIYLSLATTVHPWYILTLIPFGLLSNFYFPIVWSFVIFFTYFGYTETDFHLSMYWVLIEYLAVYACLFYEISKKYKGPQSIF